MRAALQIMPSELPPDPPIRASRRSGLDAFRLLSVLFVVGAHAGVYSGAVALVAPVLSKWSVPYFFLMLGYFLGKKSGTERTASAIERIFLMFVIASVIYLPLALARDGLGGTWVNLIQSGLYSGTYFHLWYLNSLLWGLLLFRLLDTPRGRHLMPGVALVCLLASITLASYGPIEARHVGRHLMSFPFLWLGTQLTRRVPTMREAIALLLLGIGIETIESWVLYTRLGRDFLHCPLAAGTVLYVLGMFGIAFHLPESRPLKWLGRLGGRYSGSVYVMHLYALSAVGVVAGLLHVKHSLGVRLLTIPAAMLLMLALLRAADRISPLYIDVLLGSKSALSRGVRVLLGMPRSGPGARALPSRI